MLWTFIVIFTILSMVVAPSIYDYNQGEGIEFPVGYSQSSIGNLGYSTSLCISIPIGVGEMPLSCQYGEIDVVEYGLNTGLKNPHCHNSNLPEEDCTQIVDSRIFEPCKNNTGCSVSFKKAFTT
jgi:hypothetical protein